jgi:hypothetical protein
VGIDDIEDLLLAGSETVTTHWELRIVEEKWGEREELRLLSILSILWILLDLLDRFDRLGLRTSVRQYRLDGLEANTRSIGS